MTGTTYKVFTGSANRALAEEICQYLSLPLGDSTLGRFQDGEAYFQINENVRGTDVLDRKSTRLNSSHIQKSRMPSSA